jgi:hypothetical protein
LEDCFAENILSAEYFVRFIERWFKSHCPLYSVAKPPLDGGSSVKQQPPWTPLGGMFCRDHPSTRVFSAVHGEVIELENIPN